jgi:hypothetical protein
MGDWRKKLGAASRFLVRGPRRNYRGSEKPKDRPLVNFVGTTVIVAFDLFYLYAVTLTGSGLLADPIFWFTFFAWGVPPIVVQWAYRNAPAKRVVSSSGTLFIFWALLGFLFLRLSATISTFVPVVLSAAPGFFTGAAIGADLILLWRFSKGQMRK